MTHDQEAIQRFFEQTEQEINRLKHYPDPSKPWYGEMRASTKQKALGIRWCQERMRALLNEVPAGVKKRRDVKPEAPICPTHENNACFLSADTFVRQHVRGEDLWLYKEVLALLERWAASKMEQARKTLVKEA